MGLPSRHGKTVRERPSGRLISAMDNPFGSFVTGMSADTNALVMTALMAWCLVILPYACIQIMMWRQRRQPEPKLSVTVVCMRYAQINAQAQSNCCAYRLILQTKTAGRDGICVFIQHIIRFNCCFVEKNFWPIRGRLSSWQRYGVNKEYGLRSTWQRMVSFV